MFSAFGPVVIISLLEVIAPHCVAQFPENGGVEIQIDEDLQHECCCRCDECWPD